MQKLILFLASCAILSCNEPSSSVQNIERTENLDSLKSKFKIAYQKQNDYPALLKLANMILLIDSTDYEAIKFKSEFYIENRDYNNGLHFANKLIKINNGGYSHYLMGCAFINTNLDDSVNFYLKKADLIDSNPAYLVKLCHYYQNKRNFIKAVEIADYAISKYPSEYKLYALKGAALIGLEKWDEVVICYNKAEPYYKSDEVYFGRSFGYGNTNRMKDALKDLETAISLSPNNANYYNYRGLAKFNLKDMDGALEDLKKSADMGDPEGIQNYKDLVERLSKE